MNPHARLDDEAVTDDGGGVGGVLEAFDAQGTRGVHAEAAGLPVSVAAEVDREGAFVDVADTSNAVGYDVDGRETLQARAQLFDGQLIAGLRAKEAAEGEVVPCLRVDDEASIRSGTGIHLLNDRQLVVQARDEAADDLRRAHQVQLGVVEAVVEGDDGILRNLLTARGRTGRVFRHVQRYVR